MSAVQKVFSIGELVQEILIQAELPATELLLARQISPLFNAIIMNSSLFRTALFLEPILPPDPEDVDERLVEINPWLYELFPETSRCFFDRGHERRLYKDGTVDRYYDEREFTIGKGKMCKQGFTRQTDLSSLHDKACYLHLPTIETYDEEDFFEPEQWQEKEALWRKTYATNPILPIHVVNLLPFAHQWDIRADATLGEIFDELIIGKIIFSEPRVGDSPEEEFE